MTKSNLDGDIDALFRLPLADFIGARKSLAARLKKDARANEAERVQLLAKPSISAWTVNQLYWKHREAFDRLLASGNRFRQVQRSGKVAGMREALDGRREALAHLSDLATTLLRDAGHNPSLDTIRRITTTLEGISAYASLPDGLTPGRLTKDVDPPGFDSLSPFMPGAFTTQRTEEPARTIPSKGSSKKSLSAATKTQQKVAQAEERSRLKEMRQTRIADAKVSLQEAKKSLVDARAKAQSLDVAQKKVDAEAKEAERQRREAAERLKKATAASEDATERARSLAVELKMANKTLEDAKRTVESATRQLESLFRESP